jgi:hypothetical protein
MVITSPEPVRARFRGQSTRAMVTTAAGLRPGASSGDIEVLTALTVLRDLARRIRFSRPRRLATSGPSARSCGPGGRTCST